MPFPLFTSIKPNKSTVEQEWRLSCIASWDAAGFDMVNVAGPDGGKPRIGTILNAIRESDARYAGIINDDCRIIGYGRNMAAHLAAGLKARCALAWRLDTQDGGATAMRYGYDAFFFDTSILPDDDAGFSIGQTWWDLWFPHACETKGARIEVLPPLLLHRAHAQNWTNDEWFAHGRRFWAIIGREGTPSNADLYRLATEYPQTLRARPQTIRVMDPDIELVLRAGTQAMLRPPARESIYEIFSRIAPRWALELLHFIRPRHRLGQLRHWLQQLRRRLAGFPHADDGWSIG